MGVGLEILNTYVDIYCERGIAAPFPHWSIFARTHGLEGRLYMFVSS